MMAIWHIARREWLEQRRQPAMLGVITATFALLALLCVVNAWLLQELSEEPWIHDTVVAVVPALGDAATVVDTLAGTVVGIMNWLLFGQFLGIAAVLAGHSVLHDRQVGALPFLLLAPVTRFQLLAGKVLGALGPSFLIYAVLTASTAAIVSSFPVTAAYADRLPTAPAWWVAFLLGGPSWAVFVASVCALISQASHDVRTAQQGVWFVVLFASFLCGVMLSVLLTEGVAVQLGIASLGAVGSAAVLGAGAQLISRDLSR